MKNQIHVLLFAGSLLAFTVSPLRAQVVNDGATNTLSNVTNTFTGDVTVGTNGSFTLLILSDNALLTNSANGQIGLNATAKTNEVRLLSPTARWRMGTSLFVGNNGSASRLVVSNGAYLENNGAAMAFTSASSNNSALVSGSGSIWSNRGDLTVGYSGRGNQLIITNGGWVASRSGHVSLQAGSSNNLVVVSGSGSVWTNQFDLEFGFKDHSNRMVIEAGGLVCSDNGRIASGGDLVFGTVPINNQVLVTGPGSLWTNRSALEVNNALVGGFSQLVVSNGAAVVSGGTGSVGGTANRVVITGAGSRWANQSDFTLGGAANQLEVSGGAGMTSSNATIGSFFAGGDDTILLTGNGTVWTNRGDLTMGLASGVRAVLVASNGASVFTGGGAVLGSGAGSTFNTISITDPGTTWTLGSDIYVGSNSALNRLTVSNGAFVASSNAFVGFTTSGNNNTAIVTDLGSYWSNAYNVYVGNSGNANFMMVSNGALVSGFDAVVGNNASSSNNSVVVTGASSTWTNLADFVVGLSGNSNRLVVENGGAILCDSGTIGGFGNGNQAVLTGLGSRWSLSGDHLFVGFNGNANQLVISNGAVIQDNIAYIGENSSSRSNLAWVTGAGSVWSNADELNVGDFGSYNRLVVTNGGMVFAGTNIFIGQGSSSGSNSVVVDGGTLMAANPGGTARLDVRRGTNVLNAGVIDVDLLSITNSGGSFQFNGGTLITRGAQITPITSFEVGHAGPVPALWAVRAGATNHYVNGDLYVGRQTSFNQLLVTNGAFLTNTSSAVIGFNTGANSNTVQLIGAGSRWLYGAYLEVGYSGFGNRFEIRDGAVCNGAGFEIGANGGANYNEMFVSGIGAVWSGSSDVAIGVSGDSNRLVVSDGGFVGDHAAIIGSDLGRNNSALVTGTGSLWTNAADLLVGYSGTGSQLIVSNGGCVFVGANGLIGFSQDTSNNAVVMTDPGSRWLIQQDLYVGSNSPLNRLSISNGALVTNRSATVGYWLPLVLQTSSNEVLVTGTGTLWSISSQLAVGWNGNGNRVTISNGAVVKSFSAVTTASLATNNSIVVTGPGSAWTNQSALTLGGNTGGSDRLIVTDSGTVDTGNCLIGGTTQTTNCEVSVSGVGSVCISRSDLSVGFTGGRNRLVVTNGGTAVALSNLVLGAFFPSTNNRIVVDGGALRATNAAGTSTLDLRQGTNQFNAGVIEADRLLRTNATGIFEFNGGTLITRGAKISNPPDFVVGRTGSTPAVWDVRASVTNHLVSGAVIVGATSSFNQLVLTNGGLLTNSAISVLGQSAGANSNSATIAGVGSRWLQLNGVIVGSLSSGNRLTVSNGATLLNSGGSSYIGSDLASSNNEALITGPGTTWISGSTINVGEGGHDNRLLVTEGAQVTSVAGTIGDLFAGTSNNLATVTGGGSSWTADTFNVGFSGAGNQLVVSNSGVVFATNFVYLGLNATSTNNRLTVDGGTLRVTNVAATALFEIRRGTTVLNAGLIEADIVRMTNVPSGVLQFNGGTLSAKSSKISSGTILSIGNGVSPATMLLAGNGLHDFSGNLVVRVSSNAVLTGNGTLAGGISILSGGTLIPGSSVGKMIFSSTLSMNGGAVQMEISKNGTTLTNDQVQLNVGTLTYGGTLVVSNIGPTALANGDRFRLFVATNYAGSFSSMTLPPLSPGLTWLNKLLVDGSIEVFAPAAVPISSLAFSGAPGAVRVYAQDFNSLAISGSNPWLDNSTLLGWYAAKSVAPTPITTYVASDGSGSAGNLYSFGSTGNSDRALGSIASDAVGTIAYGLCLSNDMANSVSNFAIAYTGEQWRDGGDFAVTNTLTVWYRVSPSLFTDPEPGLVANWTQITNLSFVSPTVLVTGTPLDGNQATNRQVFSAALVPGLFVRPSQTVFFRWRDLNDSGGDQGMALDDLTIGLSPLAPQLTSITVNPSNGFVQLTGLGESNLTYGIEAASNLISPAFWQRIGSNTADSAGVFQFTDTNAPPFSNRFYRALFP